MTLYGFKMWVLCKLVNVLKKALKIKKVAGKMLGKPLE